MEPHQINDIIAALNRIAAALERAPASLPVADSATRAVASSLSGGATLPNYGRRKGEPIAGAPVADLEYYANGCRRTLDDPGKARWHERERATLAAIEAEIARQTGGAVGVANDSIDDSLPF